MTERASLVAEKRKIVGKKAKQLRNEGWIPAVIYGQGVNYEIQVENLPLRRVLRHAGTTNLIDIELGTDRHTVLAKEVQSHPTRGDVLHVDFYEVNMLEKIQVEATLITVGAAAPAAEGLGTTPQLLHTVEIECLPDNLISEIEVDLSQIATVDDMIYVRDLPVPAGVTILTDPEAVIARFEYLQIEAEEEEVEEELMFAADEAVEVEVIGRGRKEELEEEEGE